MAAAQAPASSAAPVASAAAAAPARAAPASPPQGSLWRCEERQRLEPLAAARDLKDVREKLRNGRGASTPPIMPPHSPWNAAAAKALQDTTMNAVRAELDALEGRIQGQLLRSQRVNDSLREQQNGRLERRLLHLEAAAPKTENALADLASKQRTLADEAKDNTRRIDRLDAKFWEWRQTFESNACKRFLAVERAQQHAQSALRISCSTNSDVQRRLGDRIAQVEKDIDDFVRGGAFADERARHELAGLQKRLEDLETTSAFSLASTFGSTTTASFAATPLLSPGAGSMAQHAKAQVAIDAKLAEASALAEASRRMASEAQAASLAARMDALEATMEADLETFLCDLCRFRKDGFGDSSDAALVSRSEGLLSTLHRVETRLRSELGLTASASVGVGSQDVSVATVEEEKAEEEAEEKAAMAEKALGPDDSHVARASAAAAAAAAGA
eukprot:TRINITY_DN19236_c1_g1_i1.p1 TRINITY_DN19236_c1_g1~~TRINITY_DN19236_c1_g1_i1.p1  ORF type:complete len:446 (+),score=121.46 TRINITY_DN19236_c1_g1_i1:83-1420(+)